MFLTGVEHWQKTIASIAVQFLFKKNIFGFDRGHSLELQTGLENFENFDTFTRPHRPIRERGDRRDRPPASEIARPRPRFVK
ncbi:hypothetical protein [Oxynema aestuarii]|uniref:Uncharacterized protein n=1 Tax=Oxynema aestuarii AP17 TaxID=2064643 RepID=A0A6H1TWG5_9CYAN|nr:hypothetical protein [Oxynema aestuarii]QIZ69679.1 hypothetical protein HCG48_03030 [Oxynema aestuarii AP17]